MYYLDKVLSKEERYLLALSGGPDSMALFHLLLEGGYTFHVCHVDHGWRKESKEEAKILADLCEGWKIPFYLYKIGPVKGNLEDACRKKRLSLFKEVYEKGKFDALLMAHQADDQVETILKRVFEGSFLDHLSGIKGEIILEGMRVLRPMIHVFKSEVLEYLKKKKILFFDDPTNRDPKFLRSRMRKEMIPYLEGVFGKGIKENILLLGKRIEECMDLIPVETVSRGVLGYCVNLDLLGELLLRHILSKEGITLPRGEIVKVLSLTPGKKVVIGGVQILREAKHLFIVKLPQISDFFLSELFVSRPVDDWRGIFSKATAIFLPTADCRLGLPKLGAKLQNGVELREWYRIHKVPKSLRSLVPVIWNGDQMVGECLTGKNFYSDKPLYANHLLTLKGEKITMCH